MTRLARAIPFAVCRGRDASRLRVLQLAMTLDVDHSAGEIKGLQRRINDLVGFLGLPSSWIGQDTSHIARTGSVTCSISG